MGEDQPKRMLIGGEWIGATDRTIESIDPATGNKNGDICAASAELVDAAVMSAKRAAARPSWRDMLPHQRARLLSTMADLLTERGEMLAELQMRENGKVRAECTNQVAAAAATFRYFGALCETLGAEVTPARGDYLSMTRYEPYGVIAAITPWNSPLTMEAQKIAPALAAGNAIVLKPSEVTPSTALELGRIALEAGVPPGILNVIPGSAEEAGRALVAHSEVRMISFTGGTASGRSIAGVAANRLIPVSLELGGKSPHIIFRDADLDAAIGAVVGGIFEGSGQSCVAGSRLFVQASIADRVVTALADRARNLRVDLPDAEGAQMGPIATFRHRESIERFVAGALEEGGEIVCGGVRPSDRRLQRGAFFLPTIISSVTNRSSVAQQEIFGPVLCVFPFVDEDDLIRQANDSVYGLAAGVWTSDYQRAWRLARALEVGTVWINTYKQLSVASPFGGFKQSGLGREKGVPGVRLYQQIKSIYWGLAVTSSAE